MLAVSLTRFTATGGIKVAVMEGAWDMGLLVGALCRKM